MLSDRINTILEAMDITISDVAKAGGCTPSNLNRVKNGVRTPPPSSPTIKALTDGLIVTAEQRHLTGELAAQCGAELRDRKEGLRSKLIRWLYEDEPPYVRSYQKSKTKESGKEQKTQSGLGFSKRLDSLMDLAGFSNRRLGKEAGLDPSYISRLRRGERMPRYQSPYLMTICNRILASMTSEGKLSELSELTSLTLAELDEKDGADSLRRWLFGYGAVTGYMAVDELMDTISSIDATIEKSRTQAAELRGIDEILDKAEASCGGTECTGDQRYIGTDGLRAAVTRLLAEMIKSGGKELFLYSDQPMDWMGGEYRKVLTVLMAELIRRDARITIIHTVNRSLEELVSAVEWWMPLYLSGKITSYYSMLSVGRRFSHTMFIRPGEACITGTSVAGLEKTALYTYSQESDVIAHAEEGFSCLLQDSSPLVEISQCGADCPDDGYIQTGKVLVKTDTEKVSIRRSEPPYLMFTFTHPMIVRAFRSYMEVLK